ncbi:MAG: GNAT family N-acetyltransferase [Planctomycetota bacterium]|nr:GNAT family N-acetyltransferase [Planctomycetota bacterium]
MAPPVLSFTPATASDIPAIQALARKIWYACYTEMISLEQIEYMLKRMYSTEAIEKELAAGVFWELASYRGETVGYVSCEFDKQTREVTLHKMYLLRELQGKGFGQQLLEQVKRRARELEAETITLRVNRHNEKAIKAYQRAGFAIARTNVADIGGGFVMDDYILTCTLSQNRRGE